MIDVLASEHNGWFIAKASNHANLAVFFRTRRFKELESRIALVVLLDALYIETREASGLSSETFTRVATCMNFIATHIHKLDAFWFSANVLERLLVTH